MLGINTPEITLPPGECISAAVVKAEQVAGPCRYRLINAERLRLMSQLPTRQKLMKTVLQQQQYL